jgi:hypothetical protein
MTTYTDVPTFPDYDYTYTIESFSFDNGTMIVNYVPVDTRLMAVKYSVPIWPGMDMNNMKPYLDNWSPKEKWYAQEMILTHGNTLLGTS